MAREESKKPDDMAEEAILSADGVNPIAHDEEAQLGRTAYENGFDIHFPGTVPPAYFPGFPGGPSVG